MLKTYFYNKREERKIQVHSEANWRGRLFDLAKKEDLNCHDILYFITFLIIVLRKKIVNYIYNKNNAVTKEVYGILYENNDKNNNNKDNNKDNNDKENICKLLEELCSKPQSLLDSQQRAAFQLCIEFLLKADWNKQMNKESKK